MKRRCALACALALLVAGCEGGGSANPASMLPGNGGGLSSAPGGATVIRVRVPSAGTTPLPAGTRPPAIPVSPGLLAATSTPLPTPYATPTPLGSVPAPATAAQAMSISFSGPTQVSQTIGLTPASSGCTPTAGAAICQLAVGLAPGAYTASVATYSSSIMTPVNLLFAPQTIAFSVSPGANNAVNLTLGGVPSQLQIVPASTMGAQNAQGGIDLYGAGKHQLLVEMLDANQNVIIGGGAPNYLVNQAGGQLAVSIVQPSAASPNVFTVTPPATYAGGTSTLRVTAGFAGQSGNACVQAAAVCSGSVTIDVRQVLAVANLGADTVTLYAGGQITPVATIQNGVNDPQAVVFDTSGNLFVADQPGSVTEYAPPYIGPPTTIGTGVSHPQALALDRHGNLFVANGNGANTVTEYAPPYTGAPSVTISNGVNDPVSLGLDANANLFVVNAGANTVTVYAAPYNAAPTGISNGLSGPNSLAIDARGDLFVANLNSTPNSVLEYVPPFASTSVPAAWITSGVNEQGAIGLAGPANLFVPNQGANTVTEYVTPYTSAPTTVTGGQNQPIALAVDAFGNLFVANYGNSTVTEYAPPYGGTAWTTISSGVSNPQALALSPATAPGIAIVP